LKAEWYYRVSSLEDVFYKTYFPNAGKKKALLCHYPDRFPDIPWVTGNPGLYFVMSNPNTSG
jgi:hypothetical protein